MVCFYHSKAIIFFLNEAFFIVGEKHGINTAFVRSLLVLLLKKSYVSPFF